MNIKVPFVDLDAQRARIGELVAEKIERVLDHAMFVLGPEVAELEHALANSANVAHAIACANGTDALCLLLRSEEIGVGDAVFVPAFTFAATAAVAMLCGATPFFVDITENFNIDAQSLKQAIIDARAQGLRPKAVITVDLYGLPADYEPLLEIAKNEKIRLFVDAAQSFGAKYKNTDTIAIGDGAMTSFFPTKPLGCHGDGGAIFTQNDERAEKLRMLANHGQVLGKRYNHKFVGTNSRLDSIQAAVLLAKLTIFTEEIAARQRIADEYSRLIQQQNQKITDDKQLHYIVTPSVPADRSCVWAQYTIRSQKRDALQKTCAAAGVTTIIHYPLPLSAQQGFRGCPVVSHGVPRAEQAAREVLSLPIHPYLKPQAQRNVLAALAT